jgi:polar amino acid transport system substrate-binding protein
MTDETPDTLREKLMGLGTKSVHKSYYPQLQKRLEELELFHALLDHASDFIFLVDTISGVVLDANQAACDLLGLSQVHLAWKSFLGYFELARHSPLLDALGGAADGESHEVVHVTATGERIYFELTLSTVSVGEHPYTIGVARDITARKATENALRESENRLRTLFETAPVGIFRSTLDGRYLASNPTHALIHGFDSVEDLLASERNISPMLYADPPCMDEFVRRLRATGEVKDFESLCTRKDGSQVWLTTSARLSRDPANGEEIIDGFSMDFTDRKRAEQEARESKDYLDQIINSVADPIFVKDATHRLVLVNDAECQLTGLPRDEVLGRTDYDFFPKEQVVIFWEHDDKVLRTGLADVSEEEITDTSGLKHTIVTKKTRYVSANGDKFIVGVIRDITERKLVEQRLERSEEKFRRIVESSPSAMYFFHLEPDGRLVLKGVNPAAHKMMPEASLDLLGQAIGETFAQFAGTNYPELFRKVAQGELGAQTFQTSFNSDHVLGFYDVHVFRTGPDNVAVDILDITERVRLQEMMVQTEKMMSLGGLAAGMAHEINNPLGGIMQGAQVALKRLVTDSPMNIEVAQQTGCDLAAMRRFLERRGVLTMIEAMRESAVRAAKIVSSMLEFNRKSPITHVSADMNALLDKAVELSATDYDLKKKYDFRRILIVRDYAPRLPEVMCSVTQIQQVVMNLLANAAQAMTERPGGGSSPAITLRTRLEGGFVRIDVEDNGPGMTEDVRRKVFEPFFTTKPPGDGTGLGLSVSYFIIVQNHGGVMRVESQPGVGSTFIIMLPARTISVEPGSTGETFHINPSP